MSNAVEQAYTVIRMSILDGSATQNSRLREASLAKQIGVSRTPVREALRRLDSEGLVEYLPNRGARVVSYSEQELGEVYDLRALLEAHAAALAAQHIDAISLERLRETATSMERLVDHAARGSRDEMALLNNQFHHTVIEAGQSERLSRLIANVVLNPLIYRCFHLYTPDMLKRSCIHHREIVAALESRDASWAAAVMRAHILSARAFLLTDQGGLVNLAMNRPESSGGC